jgi:hypothetical protein
MNAITGVAGGAPGGLSEVATEARQYTLRRTGRKAVRFTGWQVVEARGVGDTGNVWYDLTLYRSEANEIIVELVARRRMLDEQDLSRVAVFDTLAAAGAWLEAYPCANDVPIPAILAAAEGPMALAVLQAVQLRQRIARITEEYYSLLSDVFEVLDITDMPVPRNEPESE